MEKAVEKAVKKTEKKTAKILKDENISLEAIAKETGLSIDEIKAL